MCRQCVDHGIYSMILELSVEIPAGYIKEWFNLCKQGKFSCKLFLTQTEMSFEAFWLIHMGAHPGKGASKK